MKVGVVGLGYVGLSTAVTMATKFETIGVDVDKARVDQLSEGKVPIHEKGLKGLLTKGLRSRRLRFTTRVMDLVGSDAVFVTVGTPSLPDGSIDLSQIRRAATDVASVVRASGGKPLLVLRSTVIPGTLTNAFAPLIEEASGKKRGSGFLVCSNPEFLREGSAISDSLRPTRIVIGGDTGSLAAAKSIYRRFYGVRTPEIVETTPEGAELIKYGSNSYLATKLSLINLIANLSETFPGTDVNDVALGMGLDPRIGRQFLQAGPGFGGSCFSKDLMAFSAYLRSMALDPTILEGVLRVNDFQPSHVLAMAEAAAGSLGGKKVAVLGLAFKAETSDTRDSRSIPLIRGLLDRGAGVQAYDPAAVLPESLRGAVTQSKTARECISGADLAITMTAWKEFQNLKPREFARLMKTPVLIDARRIYDPEAYSKGLRYLAIGLGGTRAS